MIEFRQVVGILCPMKLMKNIRNGAINHSKLRFPDFRKYVLHRKQKGRHDMARLTGKDADGHIISTEEEWLLASKGFINKDEMYKIMMHLTEKLYEYEVADLNMCEWKRNSAFPETINNPHVSERENIATTKFCPYCGKKIKIVN